MAVASRVPAITFGRVGAGSERLAIQWHGWVKHNTDQGKGVVPEPEPVGERQLVAPDALNEGPGEAFGIEDTVKALLARVELDPLLRVDPGHVERRALLGEQEPCRLARLTQHLPAGADEDQRGPQYRLTKEID